jgi:hypothetical protein
MWGGQGECWWWCRMKLRGTNPGQGVLTGIEERLCSRVAHPCWAGPNWEGCKESGMK